MWFDFGHIGMSTNLACRTHEGISAVDHFLQHVPGLSRFDIRITVVFNSILELLAVKPVVNCLQFAQIISFDVV